MVPGHLVPHNWSLIDWSLWTNGPQPIRPPWTNGPQKFGPPGQMEYSVCPGGQAVGIQKYRVQIGWGPFVQGDQIFGDHLSRGTKFDGDRLSRGINFMGIVCLGGQEVGDQKSRDQIGSGPNASQPYFDIYNKALLKMTKILGEHIRK